MSDQPRLSREPMGALEAQAARECIRVQAIKIVELKDEGDEQEQLVVDIHDILFCKGGTYPEFAKRLNDFANASRKKPSHWPAEAREEGE